MGNWGGKHIQTQNLFLLVASYIFYGWWDWRFLSLIFISSLIDFIVGQKLFTSTNIRLKKTFLAISLISNFGLLLFFKYYNFFLESFIDAFHFFGSTFTESTLQIVLPVGISFYTFQTVSYTIDIYRGNIKPTKNGIVFFAFVSFFPQLVAGPIERASHLLPQFLNQRKLKYENFTSGLQDILWGLFVKVVIADRLAIVVNEVYNNTGEYQGFTFIIATVLFAFQIYCDFSGYSRIAIGISKLFGFDLMTNFKTPYFSTSLSDFWRRWHISLSTWFRDYLYIPLGGNRTKAYRNLFITFLISGLWHGANWTFVIWGMIHGVFLIIENLFSKRHKNTKRKFTLLKSFITFSIVCFGWIFFRANSINDALSIVESIFNYSQYSLTQLKLNFVEVKKGTVYPLDVFLSYALILFLILSEYLFSKKYIFQDLKFQYKLSFYTLGIVAIYVLGVFDKNEFIYFQF